MAQSPLIRYLLQADFIPPQNVRNDQPSTLSDKQWARGFDPVLNYSIYNNGLSTLNVVLGGEWEDDRVRIDQPLLYAFPNIPQFISSKGDITRVYHEQISGPVMAAWISYPRISHRNQIGPPGRTSFAGTVDCAFTYLDRCLLIGELKAPGTITRHWNDPAMASTNKKRLGRELRG